MQKKLYFLDEQEKNRILNLHESRTHGQYLLNEATHTRTFDEKINNICKSNNYGQPNISAAEVERISNALSNTYLKPGSGYMNNQSLNRMSKLISDTKNIVNFCLVFKKFKDTTNRNLMTELNRFIYKNNVWDFTVKFPIEKLIQVSEEMKQKGDEAAYAEYMTGTTTAQTTQQQVVQQPVTNYQKVAGGYVGNAFSGNVVKQLRDTVGITGEGGLGQNDINQLYAKISALPNKQ